ncbi:MAG: glycosyltransferase, partial [Clostridia bacterium]|nr:glycosyltransferase [Clostridia bacterium]
TAHGFHFYKGAPKKNWVLYYPIEWVCARWTDRLLTITAEDEALAKRRFKAKVCRIHGVGADADKFRPVTDAQKTALRDAYGIAQSQKLIVCVGELLPNKNQKTAVAVMAEVVRACPDALLCIAGNGPEQAALQEQINSLGLEDHVRLLGYTTKIADWYAMSDALIACSYREGLPMNVIEAMLSAKPVVASVNRGHRELVVDGVTGHLVQPNDASAYAQGLIGLLQNQTLYKQMADAARERAQAYTAQRVKRELEEIYSDL